LNAQRSPTHEPPLILIVDDSRAMRRIVMRELRGAGLEDAVFLEAGNGREALEVMRSRRPPLVLADWNMPEMNGGELFQAIRTEGLPCKVGFVTSEVTDVVRRLVVEEGALFVVGKPFTAQDFRDALKDVFSPATISLPRLAAVGELFSSLLGQQVAVRTGLPVSFHSPAPTILGTFHRREAVALAAVIAFDDRLACAVASELEGAELPALVTGRAPATALVENLTEVLEVGAQLFGSEGSVPVVFGKMRLHPPALPIELMTTIVSPSRRLDLSVELAHRCGSLSFFVR
jgi:two-component system chemotaxis response regulator CheY